MGGRGSSSSLTGKGLNGTTKAETYQEYEYNKDGADIYEVLNINGEKSRVYVGNVYTSRLSEKEKQNVYQMRNPYFFDTIKEVRDKKIIDFKDKKDLLKKIDNLAYEENIDKRFKNLINSLD